MILKPRTEQFLLSKQVVAACASDLKKIEGLRPSSTCACTHGCCMGRCVVLVALDTNASIKPQRPLVENPGGSIAKKAGFRAADSV